MPARKQISKEAILDASLCLLREGGMEALNIKELAKRLNCSTQPVYLSFSGMEELRGETAREALRYFLRFMEREDGSALRLYGSRYIAFAKEERALFQFLFMRKNAYEEMKGVLLPIIEESIRALMERYGIPYEEAHRLHDQLWVHTHGIAAMVADGYCNWDMEVARQMFQECERALCGNYEESEN